MRPATTSAPAQRVGSPIGLGDARLFWPLDPRPEEVRIEDIAHGLARVCRFGGRCRKFYSVAQHSVLVSDLLWSMNGGVRELQLHGLLHDAAEAYLGDIITPVKDSLWVNRAGAMEAFATTEARVMRAIRERFGLRELDAAGAQLVKEADDRALATEARDLMGDPSWPGLARPVADVVEPWTPAVAEQVFLDRWQVLSKPPVQLEPDYHMRGRFGGGCDPRSSD